MVAAVAVAAIAYFGGQAASLLAWSSGVPALEVLALGFGWLALAPSILLQLLLPFIVDEPNFLVGAVLWGVFFYIGRTAYLQYQARRLTSA